MRAETHPERAATAGALLRVVLAGACWAFAAVLAKYAFEHGVAPVRLAEARVAVAGAALAGFGASVAAVNLTYYLAIDHLPVGVAIALQYTGPAMLLAATALLAARGRRAGGEVGRLAWVAAGLTLAGAVLVSRALEGLGALDLPGLAAGLASAVLFATYLLTAERAGRKGAAPATTLLWGFLIAVAIWAVAAPWWSWPVAALADPKVAAAVRGVGLVGTLVPFALAVGAVRVVSAATAGIAATSEPVFAVGFAWVLLGQRLNLAQLAGAALVVAGVVLAQLASASRAAAARRGRPGSRPGTGTPPPRWP